MMTSQRFIDDRTGAIVVQVPMMEIEHFKEFDGREQPICPHCKQPEVSADAAVRWDAVAQDWSVTNVFDKDRRCENPDCEYAGCEITALWVAVPKEAAA